MWSFNVYELHTFLGQVNIFLNETLIYDEQEHWFELGDRWNQVRLEQLIRWPASADKEKLPFELLEKSRSDLLEKQPAGQAKSVGVRWSSRLSTFRQLLSAGEQESGQRSGRRRASLISRLAAAADGQTGNRATLSSSVISHQTNPLSTNTSGTPNLRARRFSHAN